MLAVPWENGPYASAISAEATPVRGRPLFGVIWGHQKGCCCWCGFLYQEAKPFFSTMRLNSYHAMRLEEMSREVEIHMRWERLTLAPSQRVGFGCCGASGYKQGTEREFQGQCKLEFSDIPHGFDNRIFVLILEKIMSWQLGWGGGLSIHRVPTLNSLCLGTLSHVSSLHPGNNFAR